jgi:WbqC-like protein family
MKKVAILQSNYIPWKGYFDMIAAVDEFIIYDDMQFTKRDWRNRNQIKTPQGARWITVPVKVKGKFDQSIKNTEIDGHDWREQHWKSISLNYKKSKHFNALSGQLEALYAVDYRYISELNRAFIEFVCNYLGIKTKISNSWDYALCDGKTERLVDLCKQAGASEYISGPAAKEYIEPRFFNDAGVSLNWFDYAGYPEYPQLWGDFVHGVTILDLLFNCGKVSKNYMRFVK